MRVLDGQYKDSLRFVVREGIAKLKPETVYVPKPKPKPKPIDPAVRAGTILRSARNLERSGKVSGALSLYRQIVEEYAGTEAAKSATERIKSLGRK